MESDSPSATRLVLIPGLGADERLFVRQVEAFPNLEVPKWIPWRDEDTLGDYARRVAETIRPVSPGETLILGGVSFGSMVAYEMASILRPRALVQIAGAQSWRDVPSFLRFNQWMIPLVRSWTLRINPRFNVILTLLSGTRSVDLNRLLSEMLLDTDPAFIRWKLRAVLRWDPDPPDSIPIIRIHGDKDCVLKPPAAGNGNQIIAGGGHLINITHYEQVNREIERIISQVDGEK